MELVEWRKWWKCAQAAATAFAYMQHGCASCSLWTYWLTVHFRFNLLGAMAAMGHSLKYDYCPRSISQLAHQLAQVVPKFFACWCVHK